MSRVIFFVVFFVISGCLLLANDADGVPTIPELLKKMYDYRMAITDMQATVTMVKPIITTNPDRETERRTYFFQVNQNKFRCDETSVNTKFQKSWLTQYIHTPELFFSRYPTTMLDINDGVGLMMSTKVSENFKTHDLRRIGTTWGSLDVMYAKSFDYDTILNEFYPPNGVDFKVTPDELRAQKLWKVSYRIKKPIINNTYWLDAEKGYNIVRAVCDASSVNLRSEYDVTLKKHLSENGDVWFPEKTVYWRKDQTTELKEEVVVASIQFGVKNDKAFTIADLNIPVGYSVLCDGGEVKYWNGKELVDELQQSVPRVRHTSVFWTINGILLILLALALLRKQLTNRSKER